MPCRSRVVLGVFGWVLFLSPSTSAAPQRTSAELTAEDRAWWAYQPVQRPEEPEVAAAARSGGFEVRTPVDAFLWRESERRGERLPGAVAKSLWLRRVTYDLTGLPPTPEEIEAFAADPSPEAYERVVDRLLASPRFGEKWARHWLDVVRYAESDGYKQDAYRPEAWRYRDWVVGAFNEDLPYDRFVQEQLAGDVMFPGDPSALVATGFYRAAVYEYNNRDAATQWSGILAETTDTVGDAFLGLGLQCARCHNHKYDAIQQDDYQRLQSCFSGMIWRDDQPAAGPEEIARWNAQEADWRSAHAEALDALQAIEAPYRQKLADSALDKFPKNLEAIWRKGEAGWSFEERPWMDFIRRQIDEEWRDLGKAMKPDEKKRWHELTEAVATAEATRPPALPKALTVADMAPAQAASAAAGGGQSAFLAVLGAEAAQGMGRAALARWISRPDHPLTARVIVNRLWHEYFGRGLVATPNDFGRLGEMPSSPELLDWLAAECVDGGWRLKRLHRLIVTSEAYRVGAGGGSWWRAPLPRRLTAEQIRDASLAASGELNLDEGGPSVSSDQSRRTIYTKVLRNSPDPLLQSFDAPDGFRSTGMRQQTVTPTQSLLLVNGPWMQRRSQALAADLIRQWPEQTIERLRHAYLRVTGQDPTSEAIAEAFTFIKRQTGIVRDDAAPPAPDAAFAESRDLPRHGIALVVAPATVEKRLFPAMTAARGTAFEQGGFTVEAVVNMKSLWADGSVRTVVSRWDGDPRRHGWALGVTGKKSKITPGTLILQLVGSDADGAVRAEVAASDLSVPLNRAWFVAAAFREGEVRFTVQDLGDPDAVAKEAVLRVPVIRLAPDAELPVVLGARADVARSQPFDGLIGEARLTGRSLDAEALLPTAAPAPDAVVGHWKFEMADGLLADASPSGNALEIPVPPDTPDPEQAALADFCHVLFNSNAFLYVD
ncbi:MAG: DUF1549 domain-containing protein [Verrucomicrobiales bacterium]